MKRIAASSTALAMAAAALAGCGTLQGPQPTAERRAACEQMLTTMGEGATHSHTSDKTGAVNAMGLTHAQCRRMLGR
ncbi:hypothetical protein [Phenylobacterium zucineum]|uniref:Conserved hypothetical hydroxylase n=1 Tax=Phenylobacterium zucineum (strain HLK1) TaxID=450851 RepID=B4RII2_PHEZH|nr:hypothetical protein [Phenylobacterium zucineum]ACG80157.1 conserved hypothetical hydroxylase [Phenylobacterium zucineum HLK1]